MTIELLFCALCDVRTANIFSHSKRPILPLLSCVMLRARSSFYHTSICLICALQEGVHSRHHNNNWNYHTIIFYFSLFSIPPRVEKLDALPNTTTRRPYLLLAVIGCKLGRSSCKSTNPASLSFDECTLFVQSHLHLSSSPPSRPISHPLSLSLSLSLFLTDIPLYTTNISISAQQPRMTFHA